MNEAPTYDTVNQETFILDLLERAKKAGADSAEIALHTSRGLSLEVRKAALENIDSDDTNDLGLRVFIGKKTASAAISDLSPATLDRLIERLIATARLAPDDSYCGLATPDQLYRPKADDALKLDLFDAYEPTPEILKERALMLEALGLERDLCLTSEGSEAGYRVGQSGFATTNGFLGHHKSSRFSQSVSYIAKGNEEAMERDAKGQSVRHFSDLKPISEISIEAANRALARLNPQKISSQKCAVYFDRRVSSQIVSAFLGAISGPSLVRGSSFLKDMVGKEIFSKDISILDDPFRVRGFGSGFFDDEGLPTVERALVENGVLTTYLHNLASSRQSGEAPTGHAARGLVGTASVSTHNVTMSNGTSSPASLRAHAKKGMWVTRLFGPSLNHDTGDWSAGASGFWFEGEDAYPVDEITVAGNLKDMFARMICADDLIIEGSLDVPGLLIDQLTLGGL